MDVAMWDATDVPGQLLDMPDTLLTHVLCHLEAFAEVAACRCCCARLGALAGDDEVWAHLCVAQFGLRKPRPPPSAGDGLPCTSFREAARAWAAFASSLRLDQFRDTDGKLSTLVPSTIAAAETWAKLERWCSLNLRELGETLAPPATQAAWDSFEATVVGPAPTEAVRRALLPLRLITSLHDGQDLRYDLLTAAPSGAIEVDDETLLALSEDTDDAVLNRQRSLGLLGGYSAYDIHVSSRLYPLQLMAGWTCLLRRRMPLFGPSHVVIGASFDLSKHICLDLDTGQVLIGGLQRERLAPVSALPLARPGGTGDTGALLAWLGEYASRLSAGEFGAADLVPLSPITRGISMMPRAGLRCATAVTRGIEVAASAVHAHEHGSVIYSLRIRILKEGEAGYEDPSQRGYDTAQLRSRHWIIRSAGRVPEEVRGPGVIGKYPLLYVGGWRDDEQDRSGNVRPGRECQGAFVYQSMSEPRDSFEGQLLFVPGSLVEPTGPPFPVTVARFPLVRGSDEWAF